MSYALPPKKSFGSLTLPRLTGMACWRPSGYAQRERTEGHSFHRIHEVLLCVWTHNGRGTAILQFLWVQFRCQIVSQASYKPEARRGVLAVREPRFIYSPAQGSPALAAPRFSRPTPIGYLPRPAYPSRSIRIHERAF